MYLFLKFLVLGGKYLSQLTAQSIAEAYKRSVQLGRTLGHHCNRSNYVLCNYDSILDLYNRNLQDLADTPCSHLASFNQNHRLDFDTSLNEYGRLCENELAYIPEGCSSAVASLFPEETGQSLHTDLMSRTCKDQPFAKQSSKQERENLLIPVAEFLDRHSEYIQNANKTFKTLQSDIKFKCEQMHRLQLHQLYSEMEKQERYAENLRAVSEEVANCTKLMRCAQKQFDAMEECNNTKQLFKSIQQIISDVESIAILLQINDEHFHRFEMGLKNHLGPSCELKLQMLDERLMALPTLMSMRKSHRSEWENLQDVNQEAFERLERGLRLPLVDRWRRNSKQKEQNNKSTIDKFPYRSHLGYFKFSSSKKRLQGLLTVRLVDSLQHHNAPLISSWIKDGEVVNAGKPHEQQTPAQLQISGEDFKEASMATTTISPPFWKKLRPEKKVLSVDLFLYDAIGSKEAIDVPRSDSSFSELVTLADKVDKVSERATSFVHPVQGSSDIFGLCPSTHECNDALATNAQGNMLPLKDSALSDKKPLTFDEVKKKICSVMTAIRNTIISEKGSTKMDPISYRILADKENKYYAVKPSKNVINESIEQPTVSGLEGSRVSRDITRTSINEPKTKLVEFRELESDLVPASNVLTDLDVISQKNESVQRSQMLDTRKPDFLKCSPNNQFVNNVQDLLHIGSTNISEFPGSQFSLHNVRCPTRNLTVTKNTNEHNNNSEVVATHVMEEKEKEKEEGPLKMNKYIGAASVLEKKCYRMYSKQYEVGASSSKECFKPRRNFPQKFRNSNAVMKANSNECSLVDAINSARKPESYINVRQFSVDKTLAFCSDPKLKGNNEKSDSNKEQDRLDDQQLRRDDDHDRDDLPCDAECAPKSKSTAFSSALFGERKYTYPEPKGTSNAYSEFLDIFADDSCKEKSGIQDSVDNDEVNMPLSKMIKEITEKKMEAPSLDMIVSDLCAITETIKKGSCKLPHLESINLTEDTVWSRRPIQKMHSTMAEKDNRSIKSEEGSVLELEQRPSVNEGLTANEDNGAGQTYNKINKQLKQLSKDHNPIKVSVDSLPSTRSNDSDEVPKKKSELTLQFSKDDQNQTRMVLAGEDFFIEEESTPLQTPTNDSRSIDASVKANNDIQYSERKKRHLNLFDLNEFYHKTSEHQQREAKDKIVIDYSMVSHKKTEGDYDKDPPAELHDARKIDVDNELESEGYRTTIARARGPRVNERFAKKKPDEDDTFSNSPPFQKRYQSTEKAKLINFRQEELVERAPLAGTIQTASSAIDVQSKGHPGELGTRWPAMNARAKTANSARLNVKPAPMRNSRCNELRPGERNHFVGVPETKIREHPYRLKPTKANEVTRNNTIEKSTNELRNLNMPIKNNRLNPGQINMTQVPMKKKINEKVVALPQALTDRSNRQEQYLNRMVSNDIQRDVRTVNIGPQDTTKNNENRLKKPPPVAHPVTKKRDMIDGLRFVMAENEHEPSDLKLYRIQEVDDQMANDYNYRNQSAKGGIPIEYGKFDVKVPRLVMRDIKGNQNSIEAQILDKKSIKSKDIGVPASELNESGSMSDKQVIHLSVRDDKKSMHSIPMLEHREDRIANVSQKPKGYTDIVGKQRSEEAKNIGVGKQQPESEGGPESLNVKRMKEFSHVEQDLIKSGTCLQSSVTQNSTNARSANNEGSAKSLDITHSTITDSKKSSENRRNMSKYFKETFIDIRENSTPPMVKTMSKQILFNLGQRNEYGTLPIKTLEKQKSINQAKEPEEKVPPKKIAKSKELAESSNAENNIKRLIVLDERVKDLENERHKQFTANAQKPKVPTISVKSKVPSLSEPVLQRPLPPLPKLKLPSVKRKNLIPDLPKVLQTSQIVEPKKMPSKQEETKLKTIKNGNVTKAKTMLKKINKEAVKDILSAYTRETSLGPLNGKLAKKNTSDIKSKPPQSQFDLTKLNRLKIVQNEAKKELQKMAQVDEDDVKPQPVNYEISKFTNHFGHHLARLREADQRKQGSFNAEKYRKNLEKELQALTALPIIKEKPVEKKTFVYKPPAGRVRFNEQKPSISEVRKTIVKHLRSPMKKRTLERIFEER